jgi:hypothetical protein
MSSLYPNFSSLGPGKEFIINLISMSRNFANFCSYFVIKGIFFPCQTKAFLLALSSMFCELFTPLDNKIQAQLSKANKVSGHRNQVYYEFFSWTQG